MATLAMLFRRPMAAPAAKTRAAGDASAASDNRFRLRTLPNEDVYLYMKRIDNGRIVRQPLPSARTEWSVIGMACLAALMLMGALTPRVANIFAGYELESLKQEQQRLLDEQRQLDITEARLSRQENLEVLAKRHDLAVPASGQVVHLDPKGDSRLALNRR